MNPFHYYEELYVLLHWLPCQSLFHSGKKKHMEYHLLLNTSSRTSCVNCPFSREWLHDTVCRILQYNPPLSEWTWTFGWHQPLAAHHFLPFLRPLSAAAGLLPHSVLSSLMRQHLFDSHWKGKCQSRNQNTLPAVVQTKNRMNLDICSQRFRIDGRSFSSTKREFPATTGIPTEHEARLQLLLRCSRVEDMVTAEAGADQDTCYLLVLLK